MRNFILSAQQANLLINSENLEEKRSFLQKIGSDWTLQNKNASWEPQKEWALALSKMRFSSGAGERNRTAVFGLATRRTNHCTTPAYL
jgi:hypothetical protein